MRPFSEGYPYSAGTALLAPLPSDHIDVRSLAANTAENHTIPQSARFVTFSSTGDFYARFGAAASIPAGDVLDGTASDFNPTQRRIPEGVTTIGLIAPTDCKIQLAFYA